ncbi:hypothetical protein ACP70R_037828 [Stipagrostis hirtigluma subsp. patula]
MAATAAAQSSGAAVFSSQHPMARPAFHVAPHELFRRPTVAPLETMKAPAPAGEPLRLSDLEKVGFLGEGASGVVSKARHRRTGAVFALKMARYPGTDVAEEVEALRRAAAGPSPHVVRCHAVLRGADDDEDEEPAYVLELMDAGTLGDVLRRRGTRGVPEPALAEVASRCLDGLAHIHSRGVAHLDMKPDNLLANARGDVKIADFSVSRLLYGRSGERLRVSIAVGSLLHLSPERLQPNAHAGPRGAMAADVWGLGVTLLELFLGRCPILRPGERASYEKVREAICDGEPPSVPESTAASAALRGFVAACLQKDPRRRATVAQLRAHPFVAGRDVEESRRALRELIMEGLCRSRRVAPSPN